MFYYCDQDDITYQRARPKSEYRGLAVELVDASGKNIWMKNVFVSKVKDVLKVSGTPNATCTLNIENFHVEDYGGMYAEIGHNGTLYIDGKKQRSRQ